MHPVGIFKATKKMFVRDFETAPRCREMCQIGIFILLKDGSVSFFSEEDVLMLGTVASDLSSRHHESRLIRPTGLWDRINIVCARTVLQPTITISTLVLTFFFFN